jgi:stringent starvation protein B
MSELTSTKPYIIRALHEWCVDNGLTPHLLVAVDAQTRVPMAYVKDGEIVLNLNYSATKSLLIGNEAITFSARFGGVSNNLYVPIGAVRGLFARENGQGMFFPADETGADSVSSGVAEQTPTTERIKKPSTAKKPFLKLVK